MPRPLLLAVLLAWPSPASAERPIRSLSMRGTPDFDGLAGRLAAAVPQQTDAEAPPPARGVAVEPAPAPQAPRGRRVELLLDRLLDLEAYAAAGTDGVEAEPRLRVDLSEALDLIPPIAPDRRSFVLDVVAMQGLTAALVAGSYGLGRAVGNERMQKIAKGMVRHTSETGSPIGWGPIEWKDPNYGDPYVNNLFHPLNFYAAAKYFRKRGYSFWKAFAGGMIANVLWEYLWENNEVPKSGHDLLYMNLLGSLAGAHDDLGLAWGVSPLRFDDALGHYTEFYYKPKGQVWRVYFRSEPNGHYNKEPKSHQRDRPLFVNDYSLGAGHDGTGLSVFVTGVTDTRPKSVDDIRGPSDVLDGVRLGVSLDVLKALR
jgi:hypothetical protein